MPTGSAARSRHADRFAAFDERDFQAGWVRSRDDGLAEATIIIDGLSCPACAWSNEQALQKLPGVRHAQVNFSEHRATVRWDRRKVPISEIFGAIAELGYTPHPYNPTRQSELLEAQRRLMLKRMGLAAALGMQVMMLSVALYAGAELESEARYGNFFRWVILILTLPVVLYSARAFFDPAWRDLRRGKLSMDVPVSLAILIAFCASCIATLGGGGAVYFDSVVMFVFFLLLGRFLELAARRRATQTAENLIRAAPSFAYRLNAKGDAERVDPARLAPGDEIVVREGDQVPADGMVLEGRSSIQEAVLTGESRPQYKQAGDAVLAGSINIEHPLRIEVTRPSAESTLQKIVKLLDDAAASRPAVSRVADRAASWFVAAVLVIAGVVGVYWYQADRDAWLPVVIAILVVSCPCALSLATPAALTAATNAMMKKGLLVMRNDAIEGLARTTHVVFDKTGTLTTGRLSLVDVRALGSLGVEQCLLLASALERRSAHPVARAIVSAAPAAHPGPEPGEVTIHAGQGLSAEIEGRRYVIGIPAFVAAETGLSISESEETDVQDTVILLADATELLAQFSLRDALREESRRAVSAIARSGRQILMLSGDASGVAEEVADVLGIRQVYSRMPPAAKLELVRRLQAEGATVAMVGDGVNDAPVLSAAQVAIGMGEGSDLARMNAACVLLNNNLRTLSSSIDVSERTLRVIRQNLVWAVSYNLIALPMAAAGMLAPWMAAIGMSLSSLLVVGNALRLIRAKP